MNNAILHHAELQDMKKKRKLLKKIKNQLL
jgi:hypothetical protein